MRKKLLMAGAMLSCITGCAVQPYETDEVYGYPAQEPYYYGPVYGTVYGGTIWYQDGPDRRRYIDRNHNGVPDTRERDRKHDGRPEHTEAGAGKNGSASRPPAQPNAAPNRSNSRRDSDRDGRSSRTDADRDGDGTPNSRDRSPGDHGRR